MNLSKEILKTEHFQAVFDSLREKAAENSFRLRSSPVSQNISLDWVLRSEARITKFLKSSLRRQCYSPQVSTVHEVTLDKRRKLYSLCWPDRIVEALLARVVAARIEPSLSAQLFSYRKGLGNQSALRSFSNYLRGSERRSRPVYIVKRDIAEFGESIAVPLLIFKMRSVLGQQDEYFWRLIEQFLSPRYRAHATQSEQTLKLGLPTGFALTPVCENLFLSTLDSELAHIAGGFYCRYGDDILFAHYDSQCALRAGERISHVCSAHGLRMKAEKRLDVSFQGQGGVSAPDFRVVQSIDYLGVNVSGDGLLFISASKEKKLRAEIRATAKRAFLSNRRQGMRNADLVKAVIQSINLYFKKQLQLPYLSMMLSISTNSDKLKRMDYWIAKQCLRFVFGSGHDRVLKHYSISELREQGLISLVHERNCGLRGK